MECRRGVEDARAKKNRPGRGQCGFREEGAGGDRAVLPGAAAGVSAAATQAWSMMEVKFKGIDVLAGDELRQGIKEFSSWPTIPQLYVKGELVGGSDIVREMYDSGELKELFDTKGVEYA